MCENTKRIFFWYFQYTFPSHEEISWFSKTPSTVRDWEPRRYFPEARISSGLASPTTFFFRFEEIGVKPAVCKGANAYCNFFNLSLFNIFNAYGYDLIGRTYVGWVGLESLIDIQWLHENEFVSCSCKPLIAKPYQRTFKYNIRWCNVKMLGKPWLGFRNPRM